jgi:magnesium-transporting ATPase (P-type)
MLTGESVPETKIPVANMNSKNQIENGLNNLNEKEHSKHILFGGTQVIQTRSFRNEKVKAVVVKTGFDTTKGVLIRSILYPKPGYYIFLKNMYFILILCYKLIFISTMILINISVH